MAPISRGTNSVHQLFEAQAAQNPERIALELGESCITYGELNARANQIAHKLISIGVKPEEPVGIAMLRSPDQIAGVLGIMKAGGAYLPLDPAYPLERIRLILKEANSGFLLTDTSSLSLVENSGARTVCVDELDDFRDDLGIPDLDIGAHDLAYVMFTSGSTGVPKGVMVEHRSIIRLVRNTDYVNFRPDNVFLQFAPLTFDASTFEIWGALLNGARLAIAPDGMTALSDLGCLIRQHGVTTLWLTAGLFHLMVDERIGDLGTIDQLVAGGDVLSVPHVRRVLEELDCDLINGYGPTENTTFTCCYKIPRDKELGRTVPIGKPVAGTEVYILDDDLVPVAEGEEGELFCGGKGVARGYLGRGDLTAERFIPNPFSESSSDRLYRTGDLCRTLPDGNIEFLGRKDGQFKIRGYRIEPEEIELELKKCVGVREAVVLADVLPDGERQLAAFVVADADMSADASGLKKELAAGLPAHMIPAVVSFVEKLPLTANGKVDRAKLLASLAADRRTGGSSTLGDSSTEGRVAEILQEVLGAREIAPDDNFFDLGADSLRLARFHSRLQAEFDPDLKITSVFEFPSVKAISAFLEKEEVNGALAAEIRTRAERRRSAVSGFRRAQRREV
ncbi:MAG: non-ribosomal peptide synthetase [Acidobacteriota bacterium]|nr:MAG: non-ribosomal peptide synthetase [Acidobacteriota bacterium]